MLKLYIIRHGPAGKSLDDESEDKLRPLTKKGKVKMKDIARGMAELGINFDVVLTSPLVRAVETADIVNEHCGQSKQPILTDLLSPGASYQKLIRFLNQLKKAKRVAIVGHEPFLSGFVSFTVSGCDHSFVTLKKGGVAVLEIEKVLKPGCCVLSCLLEPKHLMN